MRHHIRSPRARLLLASEAGDEPALLGYALLLSRNGSDLGRIYSIAVDARARGRGVAAALLQALETVAAADGLSALRLEVRQDNRAAQALYARQGYLRRGGKPGYYEDGMDAQCWIKQIGAAG